jgi:cell division protein FtsN
MIGFVLLGIIALGALVGGIWWATHRGPDPALVADGSTIAAPEGPYKEAPKDGGGKQMDGTGDTSFGVSQGQDRQAQLAGDDAAKPEVEISKPATNAPASGGVGVQVGAFSSQAKAEAEWARLQGQHSALSGVGHRVIQGQADIGTVYRLQAVAGDASAASALCARLRASGVSCQVK